MGLPAGRWCFASRCGARCAAAVQGDGTWQLAGRRGDGGGAHLGLPGRAWLRLLLPPPWHHPTLNSWRWQPGPQQAGRGPPRGPAHRPEWQRETESAAWFSAGLCKLGSVENGGPKPKSCAQGPSFLPPAAPAPSGRLCGLASCRSPRLAGLCQNCRAAALHCHWDEVNAGGLPRNESYLRSKNGFCSVGNEGGRGWRGTAAA